MCSCTLVERFKHGSESSRHGQYRRESDSRFLRTDSTFGQKFGRLGQFPIYCLALQTGPTVGNAAATHEYLLL